jgi:hypothetical protein
MTATDKMEASVLNGNRDCCTVCTVRKRTTDIKVALTVSKTTEQSQSITECKTSDCSCNSDEVDAESGDNHGVHIVPEVQRLTFGTKL